MKINKVPYAILLGIAAHTAYCQPTFTEQKAGHVYYIKVPDYMTKTIKLNDVASMQYINSVKNAFMVVIDDSKEELSMKGIKFANLKDFHDVNIKHLRSDENKSIESEPVVFDLKGNRFYQTELQVDFRESDDEQVKITYLITYVETKNYYYQILCWSLSSEFKQLLPDFKKLAASIKD